MFSSKYTKSHYNRSGRRRKKKGTKINSHKVAPLPELFWNASSSRWKQSVSWGDIFTYFTVLIVSFQLTRTGVQHTELFCWRIVKYIHVLNCSLLSTHIAQCNNRNVCLRCQAFVAKTLQYAHQGSRREIIIPFSPIKPQSPMAKLTNPFLWQREA